MSIKYKIIPVVFLVLLSSCVGMSNRTSDTGEIIKIQNLNQIDGIYKNSSIEGRFYYENDKMYLSPLILPDVNRGASNWKEAVRDIEYIKVITNNNQIRVEALNTQFQTIASKTYTSGVDFKFEDGVIELKSETKAVSDGLLGVEYSSRKFVLNDKNNILLKDSGGGIGLALGMFPVVAEGTDYFQFKRVK